MNARRIIVGITGASGAVFGVRLLELLREQQVETHLVMSKSAEITLSLETDHKVASVKGLASICYHANDIAAAISSGSFKTMGMIVAPCSVRSLAEISTGVTSSLLTRAADVVLKERRQLVLMVRETPLHTGHLRNMVSLSEMGAVIAPPVPAFYALPENLEDMVNHSLGRILDLFGIETNVVSRWGEEPSDGRVPKRAVRIPG